MYYIPTKKITLKRKSLVIKPRFSKNVVMSSGPPSIKIKSKKIIVKKQTFMEWFRRLFRNRKKKRI